MILYSFLLKLPADFNFKTADIFKFHLAIILNILKIMVTLKTTKTLLQNIYGNFLMEGKRIEGSILLGAYGKRLVRFITIII